MTLIEKMASDINLTTKYVNVVARTASHRYKSYDIPKKKGGVRRIDHPARELKLFQRWLITNVFARLPVHKAACAYKKGSSVQQNVIRHKAKNFVLKVDFKDFFPSIRGEDIVRLLRANIVKLRDLISTPSDIEVVRRLVCKDDRLTIGAPSSPAVSNLVMFAFDNKWSFICGNRNIIYTRYADDLYFSTNERDVLAGILVDLREDLKTRRPLLQINNEKTVFTSRKRRRLVTGLVLTPAGSISLGRKRKRFIKSMVFQKTKHKLQSEQLTYLEGMLSYARSVEPAFVEALRKKYGSPAIEQQQTISILQMPRSLPSRSINFARAKTSSKRSVHRYC
jgi:RNA-directed DNA polymerase